MIKVTDRALKVIDALICPRELVSQLLVIGLQVCADKTSATALLLGSLIALVLDNHLCQMSVLHRDRSIYSLSGRHLSLADW